MRPGSWLDRHRRIAKSVRGVAIICAAALVLGSADLAAGDDGNAHMITLHFTKTVGLYNGAQVRILGVPVGKVKSITPEGTSVAIRAEITKDVKIPASVQAYIEIPALVSDRYVQLSPAYTSGPALADNANIPLARTHAPVEKDQIEASLTQLAEALGPQGANKNGSLQTLLHASAQTLAGNGTEINETVTAIGQLTKALDDNKSGLNGTVDQLDTFVQTLANDDGGIRQLFADLTSVSTQLADDRTSLAGAIKSLSTATGQVATFVNQNKNQLTTALSGLLDTTNVLVQDKQALSETLDDAPLALSNVAQAYNPATQTLDTRDNITGALTDPTYLCAVLQGFQLVQNGKLLGLLTLPNCSAAAGSAGSAIPGILGNLGDLGGLLSGLTGQSITSGSSGSSNTSKPAATPAPTTKASTAPAAPTVVPTPSSNDGNPLSSLLGGLLGSGK